MSGQITKQLGEKLYLNAQLWDMEASLPKVVVAEIFTGNMVFLGEVTLTHVQDGIFAESSEVMPNEETLLVKYYTYKADGVTLDTDNYGVEEERYTLTASSLGNTIVYGEGLDGTLEDLNVVATIDDSLISGTIEDETLTGIVEEGEI